MATKYSVWVGGGEVNSDYIYSKEEADDIADAWRAKGYDDVYVEEIEYSPDDEEMPWDYFKHSE